MLWYLYLTTSASWSPIWHPNSNSWMSPVHSHSGNEPLSSSPVNHILPNTSVHVPAVTLSSFDFFFFHIVLFIQWVNLYPFLFFLFFFKDFDWLIDWLLCWVSVSVLGLSLVASSGGHSSSRCVGLSLPRPLLLRSTGSRRAGSVVVAHGPSCSAECGIFPDQGSNPCPLH